MYRTTVEGPRLEGTWKDHPPDTQVSASPPVDSRRHGFPHLHLLRRAQIAREMEAATAAAAAAATSAAEATAISIAAAASDQVGLQITSEMKAGTVHPTSVRKDRKVSPPGTSLSSCPVHAHTPSIERVRSLSTFTTALFTMRAVLYLTRLVYR